MHWLRLSTAGGLRRGYWIVIRAASSRYFIGGGIYGYGGRNSTV